MALTEDKKILDLDTENTDPTRSRRTFLRLGIYAIGGGVTAVLAVPLVGYFIAPATNSSGQEVRKPIGKVADFANQTELKQVTLKDVEYIDVFKPSKITKVVFVRALKPGAATAADFVVLSSQCTHAGCAVAYVAKDKDLYCGCHGSHFDQNGERTAGPAFKPLGKYDIKVENGELTINILQSFGA